MVFGQSKDLGTCKSTKKNGEKCTAFVNTGKCEFCMYHIKQEYQKCSKRSELQSSFAGRGLTALQNKLLGKKELTYGGKVYTSIPAKKSKKLAGKDENRLRLLSGMTVPSVSQAPKTAKQKKLAAQLEMSVNQKRRDLEMLKKLGGLKDVVNDGVKSKFVAQTVSSTVTLEESKKTALDVISKLKAKNSSQKELSEKNDKNRVECEGIVEAGNFNDSSDCDMDISTQESESFYAGSNQNLKESGKLNTLKLKDKTLHKDSKSNSTSRLNTESPRLSNLEEIDLNMDDTDFKNLSNGLNNDLKGSAASQVDDLKSTNVVKSDLEVGKRNNNSSFKNADAVRKEQKGKEAAANVSVDIKEKASGAELLSEKGGTSDCYSKENLKLVKEREEHQEEDILKKVPHKSKDSSRNEKAATPQNKASSKDTAPASTSRKIFDDVKNPQRPMLNHLEEIDLNMDYTNIKKLPVDINSELENSGMSVKENLKEAKKLGKNSKIKGLAGSSTADVKSRKSSSLNACGSKENDLKELSHQNFENKPNDSYNTKEQDKSLNHSINRETAAPKNSATKSNNISMDIPMLLNLKDKQIDLTIPISKKQMNRAKLNAVKYIQRNGPIKKVDPNSVRGAAKKRTFLSLETAQNDAKKRKIEENEFYSERFKKMMAMTSSHTDLLEQHDDEEQEKYFQKLEMKERLEEKMTSIYKVPCKAVRCSKCKYTSFSASELCKTERHPLKVFDAVKRFFKCGDCGNRTACLEVVPTRECKNCGSGRWERTTMMKERVVGGAHTLSIRGGEQKFVNSVVTDTNVDLMVADD